MMGKLTWDNKTNITKDITFSKTKYKNYFDKVALDDGSVEAQTINGTTHHNWNNKLYWEDNLNVLYHLLNDFTEKIDLIYRIIWHI